MGLKFEKLHVWQKAIIYFSFLWIICGGGFILAQTYQETFDTRGEGVTLNGIDKWQLTQGDSDTAITQSGTTLGGTGKSLKLSGEEQWPSLSRSDTYGTVNPAWIEFVAKPGLGSEKKDIPQGKVAAVTFDYSGKIYASSGTAWIDTHERFDPNTWYKVALRLHFNQKKYDLFISPYTTGEPPLTLIEHNLSFIDSSHGTLSSVGFEGAYSERRSDDSYIENVVVHFINQLQIITPAQTIEKDRVSAPITLQLQDNYAGIQYAWKDITLELHSSSLTGEFSVDNTDWQPIGTLTIPEGAAQATFYYRDSEEGTHMISVNEFPSREWVDATQEIVVTGEYNYFDILFTTPQVAGEYFDAQIVAKDEYGNTLTSYNGDIDIITEYISPSGGQYFVTPSSATGFIDGILHTQLMYPDAGVIKIKVQDTGESWRVATSGEIEFIPAGFDVSVSDNVKNVAEDFTVTVTALNAQGNPTPNYQGSVVFSAQGVNPQDTGGGSIIPSTVSGFISGFLTTTVQYDRWGTVTLVASDQNYPNQNGQSQEITFLPSKFVVRPDYPEGRNFFYTGEDFNITVLCLDEEDNPISNYQGVISLSASVGLGIPGSYQFLETDAGSKTFSNNLDNPGIYKLSLQEEGSDLEAEAEFEIKLATLIVDPPSETPVGTVEVPVYLVDEDGNIIPENDLPVTVSVEEEDQNYSAFSSAFSSPIYLLNGKAIVVVGNTEAETVILTPASGKYKFNIKKGKVKFGRISRTGVGTLFWREIKKGEE